MGAFFINFLTYPCSISKLYHSCDWSSNSEAKNRHGRVTIGGCKMVNFSFDVFGHQCFHQNKKASSMIKLKVYLVPFTKYDLLAV